MKNNRENFHFNVKDLLGIPFFYSSVHLFIENFSNQPTYSMMLTIIIWISVVYNLCIKDKTKQNKKNFEPPHWPWIRMQFFIELIGKKKFVFLFFSLLNEMKWNQMKLSHYQKKMCVFSLATCHQWATETWKFI